MEIKHVTGKSVETDKLPDVDAMLMEESQKIHALFKKYNRQMFLVGEMKSGTDGTANNGCAFFHILPDEEKFKNPTTEEDIREANVAKSEYWSRVDGYVRSLTHHRFGIGIIPPPQVIPYPPQDE